MKYHVRASYAREGKCSLSKCSQYRTVQRANADQYWLPFPPSQGLLLRIGIKVADEWQISLDYVRGSNIYVRGSLDLRAWSLRLRA